MNNTTIINIPYLQTYFQVCESDFSENIWLSSLRDSEINTEGLVFVPQSGVNPGMSTSDAGAPSGNSVTVTEITGSTMDATADATVRTVVKEAQVFLPSQLRNSAADGTHPDIAFYLRKPVKAEVGNFSITDSSSTFNVTSIFDPIKVHNVMLDKLRGVYAFRATTVLTLQVNATRFQSGRYILAFLPTGGAPTYNESTKTLKRMRTYTATQVTQLLHVEIDLSRDTEVTLRIPYTCFANSTPMTKVAAAFENHVPGFFFLYPYIALQSGSGDNTCAYTLWVHYEDVELMGNMAPQMGAERGFSAKALNKGKDVLGMEIYSAGPVERAVNKVRVLADQVTRIPTLNAIAGSVSWLADVVGGVASMFGWSKPIIVAPITNVHNEIFSAMPNSDTHDQSVSMALTKDNRIDVLPGFAGSSIDEMSIDFFKRQFAFYMKVDWTAVQTAGTRLFKIPLAPGNFYNTHTGPLSRTVYSYTPVAYLSSLFNYYKGGLRFRLKIVKTEFHSGRLILGYYPCDSCIDETGTTATYDNLDYVQKTVIDVRDDIEWDIEIPWISTVPWKGNGRNGLEGDPYGWFCCFVQSPLLAPDSVASTVKILLEVAGSDDLAFASPRQNGFTAYGPDAILASPQMGSETVDLGTIGVTDKHATSFNDEACCIGEAVTSLRQLLKRPGPYIPYSNSKTLYFYPDQVGIFAESSEAIPAIVTHGVDMISTIACCYAFMRGSLRFNMVPINVTNVTDIDSLVQWTFHPLHFDEGAPDTYRVIKSARSAAAALSSIAIAEWSRFGAFAAGLLKWGISYSIPYYSSTHSTPVCERFVSADVNREYIYQPGQEGQSNALVGVFVSTVGNLNTTVMRHTGDDFNLGFFSGVPPLIVLGLT
jgi:hypothetical protein